MARKSNPTLKAAVTMRSLFKTRRGDSMDLTYEAALITRDFLWHMCVRFVRHLC